MNGLGQHWGYIVAAYGAAALVVAGLILRAVIDWRGQSAALARLEERGVSRRSARRSAVVAGARSEATKPGGGVGAGTRHQAHAHIGRAEVGHHGVDIAWQPARVDVERPADRMVERLRPALVRAERYEGPIAKRDPVQPPRDTSF